MADRVYKLDIGWRVTAPENCCLFCDHCTDIFYDSGGIYATWCDLGLDTYAGSCGECSSFVEEDGEEVNDNGRLQAADDSRVLAGEGSV